MEELLKRMREATDPHAVWISEEAKAIPRGTPEKRALHNAYLERCRELRAARKPSEELLKRMREATDPYALWTSEEARGKEWHDAYLERCRELRAAAERRKEQRRRESEELLRQIEAGETHYTRDLNGILLPEHRTRAAAFRKEQRDLHRLYERCKKEELRFDPTLLFEKRRRVEATPGRKFKDIGKIHAAIRVAHKPNVVREAPEWWTDPASYVNCRMSGFSHWHGPGDRTWRYYLQVEHGHVGELEEGVEVFLPQAGRVVGRAFNRADYWSLLEEHDVEFLRPTPAEDLRAYSWAMRRVRGLRTFVEKGGNRRTELDWTVVMRAYNQLGWQSQGRSVADQMWEALERMGYDPELGKPVFPPVSYKRVRPPKSAFREPEP